MLGASIGEYPRDALNLFAASWRPDPALRAATFALKGCIVASGRWSHQIILSAELRSASKARDFVCLRLIEYQLLHLLHEIRLVASELSTNAIVHSCTPFDVSLDGRSDRVVLTVREGQLRSLPVSWYRFNRAGTAYIDPGSPWQNPWVESYGSRMRDELLALELFDTLLHAQVLVADWRHEYNQYRPHSALGMLTPTEYATRRRTNQPQLS